jgi:hypothetical protein
MIASLLFGLDSGLRGFKDQILASETLPSAANAYSRLLRSSLGQNLLLWSQVVEVVVILGVVSVATVEVVVSVVVLVVVVVLVDVVTGSVTIVVVHLILNLTVG